MNVRWTLDAECAVRGWWAEGKSGTEIAVLLDRELAFVVTRNAVMGKIHRLCLRRRTKGLSFGQALVEQRRAA